MLRDRRPRTGDFGRGEFEDKPALSSRNEGGGDGVSPGGDHNDVDETVLWDEAQLAEARRKMLDPPKVISHFCQSYRFVRISFNHYPFTCLSISVGAGVG